MSKEILPRQDRISLAAGYFGVYTIGLAANDFQKADEDCAMDNMRVPYYVSDLTDEQMAYLIRLKNAPKREIPTDEGFLLALQKAKESIMIHPGTTIITDFDNTPVKVQAVDSSRGPGMAYNHYIVNGFTMPGSSVPGELNIFFQNGAPVDGVFNGVTLESLMAVCVHRLEGFQSGPYPNDRNALAIGFLKSAIGALNLRSTELKE
jgi:hypothetical protein